MNKMNTSYTYSATVVRWVDGDTVWLDVDLGFRIRSKTDFRLYGVDTPERGQPGFMEATSRARQLAPEDSVVLIRTYQAPDKYGRWLAEIIVGTSTVNQILVNEGLGRPYYGGTRTII